MSPSFFPKKLENLSKKRWLDDLTISLLPILPLPEEEDDGCSEFWVSLTAATTAATPWFCATLTAATVLLFSTIFDHYNKPVVVFTHGDLLSLKERARVHVYLGEKLDVPPTKQVFDIPENSDSLTESSIVDMMRYSLELADKNLPFKRRRVWPGMSTLYPKGVNCQVFESTIVFTLMFLAILLGITVVSFPLCSLHKSHEPLLSSSTNSQCKSHINQLHKPCEPHIESPSHSGPNRGPNLSHENQDSHVTSESSMTSKTDPTISAPTTLIKLNTTAPTPTSNSTTSEHDKHHSKSTPTVPMKSNTGLSTPTVNSESEIEISVVTSSKHGPSNRLKRRKKRHTKPVLEWHKIRHLWAASEDQHPEPAIEWSEIRHLWGPPEDQHPEPGL